MNTVKIGLCGTGPWAKDVHGPGLAAHPDVELVGIWGRNPDKTGALAQALGVRAYSDADALIGDVDAVAIALPPDIQAPLALRAARAGRHLLLDKPVALTIPEADAVQAEVTARKLASLVFFTSRFTPAVTDFLRASERTTWFGGRALLHAALFATGSPFAASPWRRERGGLWDIGPHALAVLFPTLGRVVQVAAMTGPHDTTYLLARHAGGAVSTCSLTLDVPAAAAGWEAVLYGPEGPVAVPQDAATPLTAFGNAVGELVAMIRDGRGEHPCDIRLGRDVVATISAADVSRTTGSVVTVPPYPSPEIPSQRNDRVVPTDDDGDRDRI